MNVIVVDTSSWISYFKGKENKDIDKALEEGRCYLSPIVLAELLSAKLKEEQQKTLTEFLKELPLCDNSFGHWQRVGLLRSNLARRGISVSTPDSHVAQCVLDLDGYLISEDKIFQKLAKVIKINLI